MANFNDAIFAEDAFAVKYKIMGVLWATCFFCMNHRECAMDMVDVVALLPLMRALPPPAFLAEDLVNDASPAYHRMRALGVTLMQAHANNGNEADMFAVDAAMRDMYAAINEACGVAMEVDDA